MNLRRLAVGITGLSNRPVSLCISRRSERSDDSHPARQRHTSSAWLDAVTLSRDSSTLLRRQHERRHADCNLEWITQRYRTIAERRAPMKLLASVCSAVPRTSFARSIRTSEMAATR